jgi:hypothetical protein
MSIDHKAYLFQYDAFQEELADLLHRALQTGEVGRLHEFLNRHRTSLTDQATQEPLAEDWEEEYGQQPDVQQYADLALTRYYEVSDNLGLSHGFDALGVYLGTVSPLARHADQLICGKLFGPKGRRLDPGRMGTGLVSSSEAARFAKLLAGMKWPVIPGPESDVYSECSYRPKSADEVQQSLDQLVELYQRAAEAASGILLVDFNDHGVNHL